MQCSADGAAREQAMVRSTHYATTHHLLLDLCLHKLLACQKLWQAKKCEHPMHPHEETIQYIPLHAAGATPKITSSLLLQRPLEPLGALDGPDDDRARAVYT